MTVIVLSIVMGYRAAKTICLIDNFVSVIVLLSDNTNNEPELEDGLDEPARLPNAINKPPHGKYLM